MEISGATGFIRGSGIRTVPNLRMGREGCQPEGGAGPCSILTGAVTTPAHPARILFLGPDGVAHVTRWVRFLRSRGHEVLLACAHRIDHDEPCGGVPLVPQPGT